MFVHQLAMVDDERPRQCDPWPQHKWKYRKITKNIFTLTMMTHDSYRGSKMEIYCGYSSCRLDDSEIEIFYGYLCCWLDGSKMEIYCKNFELLMWT